MCTAISITGERALFGRTLDLELSYGESVVITPSRFPLGFEGSSSAPTHHAIIGTAHVEDGYPLYYDAMNSAGLCAAALNFPKCAVYHAEKNDAKNLAAFELIPYILSTCDSIAGARERLKKINITKRAFSASLPTTPLHWIFSDASGAIVAEPQEDGLRIYDDPFGVLTNSPEFSYHATRCADLMHLDARPPQNSAFRGVPLERYSRGMGAIGLPGDLSSASRFIRAAFVKEHTLLGDDADEINRFFHVIGAVSQPNGCALTENGAPIRTLYSSCADARSLTYYFTTYGSHRIRAVRMSAESSSGDTLTAFPMCSREDILYLN